MRKLLISLFILTYAATAFATGDSLRYLTPKDSIFISFGNYGEKYFEHTLAPKQTLFSCARFYGLRLDDVYYYNPHLKKGYEPGQKVKIPIPNKAILRYKPAEVSLEELAPIFYQVKRGDTYYGIANRYFKMPLDTIFARNNLNYQSSLENGQSLFIGWMSIEGIPDDARQFEGSPTWKMSFAARQKFIAASYKKTPITEKGAATWQQEKGGGNSLYALHRTAKVGSIIAVTNPMFNRTVYVKVIGKLQDRAYPTDTKVVVSSQVAKMLGGRDAKFYVEVKYFK